MIAKFRFYSEKMALQNFALGLRNFHYHCEIFEILAKISLCHSENHFSSMLLPAPISLYFFTSSSTFLHPRLDEIPENSYELSINQHHYKAKIEMMVEAHKTCKTIKNNLETKLVVLMDLHMSIGLIDMISTQKALKTYLK